ncbi:receptor-type tyrosine-protein phosphatase epsilon-like isoform X2 [Gigantopelta aegis]|uniref:receptor-type tyrosine-protein phosphatase epsilon-like isoform X2 n=1 Tax=Gigantopelta aegis TaxID=1735272 RepID=UPI001B88DC48|nr:receptor-type tyrosine-protein phosphatase epsilon-like isoform X2 [Gigantopelta aegis]
MVNCSDHCNGSTCNQGSGACPNGCKPGYYGEKCTVNCSDNCNGSTCNQSSGACPNGCKPGYYGEKCTVNCSDHCNGSTCNQGSGACPNGCKPGYYGDKCMVNCSDNCNGSTCNQGSGACPNGCKPGYYGNKCERNCSGNCKPREDEAHYVYCEQKSGKCMNGCVPSKYGETCNKSCSKTCVGGTCYRSSGGCTYGCDTGWKGDFCDEECSSGYYGNNCNLTCGHCIEDFGCNRFTGACPSNMCASGFTGSLCMQAVIDPAPSTGEVTVISVTAILAVVIVVLVAVIIIVVYRRRRTNTRHPKQKGDYHMVSDSSSNNGFEMKAVRNKGKKKAIKRKAKDDNKANGEDTKSGSKVTDDTEYQTLIPSTEETVIKLANLWNHVQHMKSENLFHKQFEKLPSGLVKPCDIAMKPENKMKNRYRNICAYDCSRVILTCEADDPNSDYMNACYIDGFNTPKQYIASQGPVDVNLNDFWRMIWQQNTSKIVMLTNLVEEGRIKCITYWPELNDQTVHYGNIEVKCTSVEVLAHFTVRTFKIHCITEDSSPRVVKHFHYTSWPDRGVPTDIASLVEFYIKVDKTAAHNSDPLVVHCSAGIGRTGTFLALAYLVEASKHQDFVDIFTCVSRMRHERVNMVQTQEQYEFLHDALVEAILAGNTTVSSVDFLPKLEELQTVNQDTGLVGLREQFELLNKVSPKDSLDEYTTAKLPENTSRNRFNDILASNYYRPYLSTPVEGGTDYINAVILPAYKNKCMFLLTQMPLRNTIVDFWRMIYENDSHTIVMLNGITQHRQVGQNVGIYWPSTPTVSRYGPFEVENLQHEATEFFNIITLSLEKWEDNKSHKKREIKLFQCVFWPHGQIVPRSAVPLFTIMENVQTVHQGGPVTVHCM